MHDLKRCMDSIDQEIYIPELRIYYCGKQQYGGGNLSSIIKSWRQRIQRLMWFTGTREFNYSAINNYGATFAKGEYLLLLNNDTEIINEDCLEELLGYCMRSDVGAVGSQNVL